MKKLLLCLLCLCLALSGAACAKEGAAAPEPVRVIATLFPQYDFARQVGGEYVEVSLLLPPGTESHSFEPTMQDMAAIQRADLFVYTGPEMEPWAETILSAVDQSSVLVVNCSEGVELRPEEDGDEEEEHEDEGHHHAYDPHIWLDPTLAARMVERVTEGLCAADPAHEAEYRQNAEEYLQRLDDLDQAFREVVDTGARRFVVFGGRFAHGYLMARYGLEYDSAYPSDSAATEPSVKVMARLIREITERGLPVVYHEELSASTVAQALCEQTGARPLVLYSLHTVSADQLEAGVTYLDLMYENVENLREGLN